MVTTQSNRRDLFMNGSVKMNINSRDQKKIFDSKNKINVNKKAKKKVILISSNGFVRL